MRYCRRHSHSQEERECGKCLCPGELRLQVRFGNYAVLDEIDLNGQKSTQVREAAYLEKNEIRYLTTRSMSQCNYALQTQVNADNTLKVLNANLILTYDEAGNITITTDTPDCEASGSGKWEEKAAKQAWGGKDRDQITLSYTLTYNYTDGGVKKYKTIKSNDILVMRDRQAKLETF